MERVTTTMPEARPRWAASDRLAVNPNVIGEGAQLPRPKEPTPSPPTTGLEDPAAPMRVTGSAWAKHRGVPPKEWVWSFDEDRVMTAMEAATLAGVIERRVRYACTPVEQERCGGRVGRKHKYRFRWATEAEIAAATGADGKRGAA